MDLSFDEEQRILRDSFRDFLQKEVTMDCVREMWEDEKGYSPEIWKKMGKLGWMGLRIPEEYEGNGLNFLDLAILFEEMGRVALPGPFLSTALATELIIDAGSSKQKETYLPKIARGEITATLAISEPNPRYDASGIHLSATADQDAFLLKGTKLFVLDGHTADLMIVAARTKKGRKLEKGVTLFLVEKGTPGVSKQLLKSMDGGRKQCEVDFEDVRIPADQVLGPVDGGWPALQRVLNKGAVAVSMEMVGGGQKVLELTVDYAKKRVQFDQPIGSFQAIKHKCAQIMQEVEGAKSIAYYAAWAMDQGGKEADIAASVAKTFCSDMYRKATAESLQIYGALAFTWEQDIHIFLKRAKMNEFIFGDPTFHREQLAKMLGY